VERVIHPVRVSSALQWTNIKNILHAQYLIGKQLEQKYSVTHVQVYGNDDDSTRTGIVVKSVEVIWVFLVTRTLIPV